MGLSLLHSPRYHLRGPALKWMHTGFHEIEAFLTEGVRMPIELGYTGTRVWKGAFHSESIGFLPEYLISNNSHQQWESFSFWTCLPQKKRMFFHEHHFDVISCKWMPWLYYAESIQNFPDQSYLQWGTSNHNYFSNSERKRKIGQWYGKKNLSAQTFQKTNQQPRQEYYTRLYSRFFQYVNHRIPFFFLLLFQYNSVK